MFGVGAATVRHMPSKVQAVGKVAVVAQLGGKGPAFQFAGVPGVEQARRAAFSLMRLVEVIEGAAERLKAAESPSLPLPRSDKSAALITAKSTRAAKARGPR